MHATLRRITTMLAALGAGHAAHAQLMQDFKLTPDDLSSVDYFGFSVAVSGSTVLVGSRLDDDGGLNSGSAYLFDATTGQQLFKLTADDAAKDDEFGYAAAISGANAIVGARTDDLAGINSGSVYVFDTATGQQRFKLIANDAMAGDFFGIDVALSGTTAIIGASGDDDIGSGSGSAYLFDVATGQQLHKLVPRDGWINDRFGLSVAISGTTAIVGAFLDDDAGTDSGSAYLFDTATGQELFKLTANDGAPDDQFGRAVAISGTTAVVGAWQNDEQGVWAGAAYVFDTTTGQQRFKLTADDADVLDNLGNAVAVSGTTAIVGAPGHGVGGAAYAFDTTTGQQLFKIIADDTALPDAFGHAVALAGSTVVVGAYRAGAAPEFTHAGSAYVFTPCPGACNGADLAEPYCTIDFDDIDAFVAAFVAGDPEGDCDGSGALNFDDIDCFVAAFLAGCP